MALGRLVTAGAVALFTAWLAQAAPEQDVDITYTHKVEHPSGFLNKNIGNDVFYQVFIDRFANGNSANDRLYDGRFSSTNQRDWYAFWGGDLRGLIDRMPYLKDLGVTKLWLTPVFQNQLLKVKRFRHNQNIEVTAYHGYWMSDWFRLNPFFTDRGSEDYGIMRELINKSGPDIQLVLDTVVNHTSPTDATQDSINFLNTVQPLPSGLPYPVSQVGALFKKGQYVTSYGEDDHRIRNEPGYVQRFHHFPFIRNWNNQFEVENYSLDGLSDLSQDAPENDRYFADAHNFWLQEFPGLAGYRMDTIKHVGEQYWEGFSRDLYQANSSAIVIGEYFGAGPLNTGSHEFYKKTQMSLFDFDFRNVIGSIFKDGGGMAQLTDLWARDPQMEDARTLVTFIDNHDVPRYRGQGMSYEAMKQSLALLFAARGVPCLYYGIEQDLFYANDPGDPYNRPMMTRFDTSFDLAKWTQKLIALRKGNPSLRYGSTHVVHLSDKIIGFERRYGDRWTFFATSTNQRTGSDDFYMNGLTLPDGKYADVLSGQSYDVAGGRVLVRLKKGDVIILSR